VSILEEKRTKAKGNMTATTEVVKALLLLRK
jgi:hypothetical protein